MEASNSNSSSYAWHNILRGHGVLMRGVRWRVGCGESIGVWNDAWLLSLEQPQILSSPIVGLEDIHVCDLIDPASKQWDLALLQDLSSTQEVEIISSIPLCNNHVEDKLVWPFTPSGMYTIKFGYRFLTKENFVQPIIINQNHGGRVWKLI